MGRPKKYTFLLRTLDAEDLYSAASIARFAGETGFISFDLPENERRRNMQRIRITMGRLSNNHDFPDDGDGQITLKGQAPSPAWFGWRWHDTL